MDFFKQNIIPGEVFVQLTAFLIVFFVLRKLAWGPILSALQGRREKIKTDLEKIEEAKAEIEKLKTEYTAHLQKIEEEARDKLNDAVEEGRKIAKDIQDRAREESQANFEKAKENLALEIAKARIELRREIAGLTIQVSEKVIGEKMAGENEEKKVIEMIEELDKTL